VKRTIRKIDKYKKICVESKDYPNMFLIIIAKQKKNHSSHVSFANVFEFVIIFKHLNLKLAHYRNIQWCLFSASVWQIRNF